jgi:hypothetical protein
VASLEGHPSEPPAPVDIDRTIEILDRILSAKPKHFDPRDLAALRPWVDGYWAQRGPLGPSPHPVDDTILAQMLAVAPLDQLTHLLKTLFQEGKRPEFSPAWFITVALQRLCGLRPDALKRRRAQLRVVRPPAPPQPQQEGLAFAQALTADLASKVRGR